MSFLPLVSHDSPDSIVAWRTDGPVTLRQFLADAHRLAGLFPAGKHLLNMCGDRYHFSVGLAAAILMGKISLLPSTHTPGVVRQIKDFAPDVFCLTDSDSCAVDLSQLRYPAMEAVGGADACAIPQIDGRQRIAVVFTSGSTGNPLPHAKTWGGLVSSVQAEALRLGLPHNSPCNIVGTVPPQHMYGFESTVLMAWNNGNAYSDHQPFYPADIGQALAAVPAPRVLVSSPAHLRALLDAGLELPEMSLVVSATAPLSSRIAQEIEAFCRAPLMEIYGSTETGLIATRRSTQTAEWQLLPGITLAVQGDGVYACGGHVETLTALSDVIEPVADGRFLLHGRMADLVNIAGKRHSLASLNHLLNTIPGVVDGAFFMPDETCHERIARLAACVVAPGMDAPRLLKALRAHIDPVFLPRPLLFVDALPRNSTGKLPRAALQALVHAYSARKS
ncbi:MAG: acyl-CoA synthetase [Betaproteobacteria bacterium]|nr:MAG: acyl-CoA synthetase [Betaproteobacteria bacterium]